MLQNMRQQCVQCLAISTCPVRTEIGCYRHGQLSLAVLSQDLLLKSPEVLILCLHLLTAQKLRSRLVRSLLFSSHQSFITQVLTHLNLG